MQYCPNCMIQIRGRKARCPLCQRELMDPDSWTEPEPQRHPIEKKPEAVSATAGSEEKNPEAVSAAADSEEKIPKAVFIAAGVNEKKSDSNLTLHVSALKYCWEQPRSSPEAAVGFWQPCSLSFLDGLTSGSLSIIAVIRSAC